MIISIQIHRNDGELMLTNDYKLIDSACEAMGNFERHHSFCKGCGEPYRHPEGNYCNLDCAKDAMDDTAEAEATNN
jgi:NADH pyrophosphatase NudC (nudix superfamily)